MAPKRKVVSVPKAKKSRKKRTDENVEEDAEVGVHQHEENDVQIEGDEPDEDLNMGEEDDQQEVDNEHDDEDDEEGEGDDENEEEEETSNGRKLSPEQKAANRKKKANRLAKTRGYRKIATLGGLGTKTVSSNILTLAEVGRACQYVPQDPKHAAYETLDEYKLKLGMAHEPLPRAAKAVVRASAEVLARQIAFECVLRTYESGMAKVTPHTVFSVCRPLMQATGFSSSAPLGLIRHAQTTTMGVGEKESPALNAFAIDSEQAKEESKMLPKQNDLFKGKEKEKKAKKAERFARIAKRVQEREEAAKQASEVCA